MLPGIGVNHAGFAGGVTEPRSVYAVLLGSNLSGLKPAAKPEPLSPPMLGLLRRDRPDLGLIFVGWRVKATSDSFEPCV